MLTKSDQLIFKTKMVVLAVLYLLYTQVEKGHDTLYFIFLNI